MPRKNKKHHENHERWLVSYADFVTSLAATGCTTFQSRLSECDHPGLSTNPDLLFKLEGATVDITGQIFFPILLR